MLVATLLPTLPDARELTAWLIWTVAAILGLRVVLLLLGQAVRVPLGRTSERGQDRVDRLTGLLSGVAVGFAAILALQVVMQLRG